MPRRLSRRDFVRGAAGGAVLGAGLAAGAQEEDLRKKYGDSPEPPGKPPAIDPASKRMGEMHGKTSPEMMREAQTPLSAVTFPRFDPAWPYSAPPPLMGRQMGKVHTLNIPPLGYELDGEVKVFHLTAQPVRQELTDGNYDRLMLPEMKKFMTPAAMMTKARMPPKELVGWGYNGNIPGPTIELTEGDRVRIVLKNELPEPTSIHWHGFEIPNAQDGAAPEAQPPVMPGQTYEYEFTVFQTGTLLYHSGFNIMKQDFLGLGGLVVIHPLDPPHKIDRDFAILHQEWVLKPGNPNPDITGMDFNWLSFNGKVAPSIEVMTVRQGDRVRIRQGNLSMDSHPIHLHGYTFKIVGTTGGPIPESAQWPEVTVNVWPGSTRDIEFVAWNPGVWRFHCHKLHHVMNGMTDMPMGIMQKGGMFTLLHVLPKDPAAPFRHPMEEQVLRRKREKK